MVKIKFNNSETFYNAKFRKVTDNIIQLEGVAQNTSGFKAYMGNEVIGDYSSYTTTYRTIENGYQLSNNGTVEPDKNITIKINWVGTTEYPDRVQITTNTGIDYIASPWEKVYTIKEHEELYLVGAEDLENFRKNIGTNEVTYTFIPIDPIPTLDQRVEDLEQAVCELYER